MPSPFIKGIVPLIIFFFFVVSLAYGIATGKIRRQADLLIEPALGRFKLLDFDAWRAILEAGQESGREQVAAWLAARAGAAPPWGAAAGQ